MSRMQLQLLAIFTFAAFTGTLVCSLSALAPAQAHADATSITNDAPLSEGLPLCMSKDSYRALPFLSYDFTMSGPNAYPPFSEDFQIQNLSGEKISDDSLAPLIREIFPGKHYLSLPKSTSIVQAAPDWIYPVGTEFVHEVDLETGELFEVRVLKLIGDRWAFGDYEPAPQGSNCAGELQLRTSSSDAKREIKLKQSSLGPLRITYTPLAANSCIGCHEMGEASGAKTGPCHFQNNPAIPLAQTHLESWIETFQTRFGYSPLKAAQ
jgi:hypothetical protein